MTATMATDITIDWSRVQELYAFTRARAIERILVAEAENGRVGKARHDLRVLEAMYAEARQYDDVAACAILYFRAQAMRAAEHPDFLGDWIIPARSRRQS